jgi:hypothetical protein
LRIASWDSGKFTSKSITFLVLTPRSADKSILPIVVEKSEIFQYSSTASELRWYMKLFLATSRPQTLAVVEFVSRRDVLASLTVMELFINVTVSCVVNRGSKRLKWKSSCKESIYLLSSIYEEIIWI